MFATDQFPKAIQYLSADYQPTHMQSETGIAQLTKSLGAYELTKAEKLQIVNLAPTEAVELYVVRVFFCLHAYRRGIACSYERRPPSR